MSVPIRHYSPEPKRRQNREEKIPKPAFHGQSVQTVFGPCHSDRQTSQVSHLHHCVLANLKVYHYRPFPSSRLSTTDRLYPGFPALLLRCDLFYTHIGQKIRPIAKALKITELLDKFPYEVSGGQKQRAAVARALITNPKLILADEPTGALDSKAASALLSVFGEINAEGQTILMVTHSAQAASHASRVLFIKDGEVFHQIYKGSKSRQEMYQMIADTLTILTTGGEQHA